MAILAKVLQTEKAKLFLKFENTPMKTKNHLARRTGMMPSEIVALSGLDFIQALWQVGILHWQ